MQQESIGKSLANVIIKHFNRLDETIEKCDKLKEAKSKYYVALRELHHGSDKVYKEKEEFERTLKQAQENLQVLKQEIPILCTNYKDSKLLYKNLETLTIGILGEWGSGKTHLLKEIKYSILESQEETKNLWENTPKPYEESNKLIIPIFFNAWRFEKDEHIIIPLFQTMVSELENYDYIPKLKLIKEKLKILTYSLVTNLKAGDIKRLTSGDLTAIATFFDFKDIVETFKQKSKEKDPNYWLEVLLKSDRIESVYLNIPQWIEKITIYDDVRFLFLIDDIDRCLPENAVKMLESIKLFLDVAGCSFVLAIDDDVIERGIEHHYKEYILQDDENKTGKLLLPITGAEYLEKIVQVPFHIPPKDSVDVREFLLEHYKELFEQKVIEEQIREQELNKDSKIDETLLEFLATNIPKTPRKIKRVMSLYKSKLELLQDSSIEVDKILLTKLTLLELFAPKLFRFMMQKGYVWYFERANYWIANDQIKTLSEYQNIIEDISDKVKEQLLKERATNFAKIIKEVYDSRVEFDLDIVFKESIDEDSLKEHIAFKKIAKEIKIADEDREFVEPKDKERFFERLLSQDELSWIDAFREEGIDESSYLSKEVAKEFIEREDTKEFVSNPKWLDIVSKYLSNQDFYNLIETHNPFKGEQ